MNSYKVELKTFEYPGVRGKRIQVSELEGLIEAAISKADEEKEQTRRTLRMAGGRRG